MPLHVPRSGTARTCTETPSVKGTLATAACPATAPTHLGARLADELQPALHHLGWRGRRVVTLFRQADVEPSAAAEELQSRLLYVDPLRSAAGTGAAGGTGTIAGMASASAGASLDAGPPGGSARQPAGPLSDQAPGAACVAQVLRMGPSQATLELRLKEDLQGGGILAVAEKTPLDKLREELHVLNPKPHGLLRGSQAGALAELHQAAPHGQLRVAQRRQEPLLTETHQKRQRGASSLRGGPATSQQAHQAPRNRGRQGRLRLRLLLQPGRELHSRPIEVLQRVASLEGFGEGRDQGMMEHRRALGGAQWRQRRPSHGAGRRGWGGGHRQNRW
mmetsp:Transcript_15563/g.32969  ORF Transcript_15563/g.32969 Transcript_15563/m.32969 type:complete len:334 (-) Transcript_15563:25-1026(-)